MSQKYLDLAGLTAYDKKLKEWFKAGVVDIADEAIRALFPVVQPNNEIWYTSSDGNIVNPYSTDVFGANIVSNTYENDKGVITFDGPVTSIGDNAFRNCSSLISITIPNSMTSIGERAFFGCSSLTPVTIPNSVTSIGEMAFHSCSSLTSVTIGNSVMSIGANAFYGTGVYNDKSNWENNVLYIDNCLIKAKTSISGSYTIKENTRLIAEQAFYDCSSLTSITIPNSVTSIGDHAFAWCSSLTSITIPNSVTSIEDNAFWNCEALTSITFEGTIEQWNSINKGVKWNNNVPATYVQCSDGQVTL